MAAISDPEALVEKREVEKKRRDGAIVSEDLLDYAEFHHLGMIIRKNWEPAFRPIFEDKRRFEVSIGILEDVRNAIAHSRPLLQFERDLVSGISGQIRNQVTIYRTRKDPPTQHYSVIESVRDNFGQNPLAYSTTPYVPQRLEVGDKVSFICQGSDERGREVEWLVRAAGPYPTSVRLSAPIGPAVPGAEARLELEITEAHVSEALYVDVSLRAVGARFHRHPAESTYSFFCDDSRTFLYAVNPPRD
jgi:hypothetical protein